MTTVDPGHKNCTIDTLEYKNEEKKLDTFDIEENFKINFSLISDFFLKIKKIRHQINFDILCDELMKHKTDSNYTDYHIYLKKYENLNLFALYTDNMSTSLLHNDELINDIIKNYKFIIFDIKTLLPIVTFYNKPYVDNDTEIILSNEKWTNVQVTKYYLESRHICVFYHKEKWIMCTCPDVIVELTHTDEEVDPLNTDNFHNYKNIKDKQLLLNLDKLNINYSYHFLLKNKIFRKVGYCNDNYVNSISLLWTCDKNANIIELPDDMIIQKEKLCHFSCLDEMMTSLEFINNETIVSKTLNTGGFYIRIFSSNKQKYKICILRTEIYKYILSSIPRYNNQYVNYLNLYQNNNLSSILPYLHKYPSDVIRRINMSIKTLSKELLNIYHLTRKKQNSDLYECLSQPYKKILYDLHKIYVNQKYEGFIVKKPEEILIEKKSISVEIVYNYLKEMSTEDLLQIFSERNTLIKKLTDVGYEYENILYVNNIDIITQTELMTMKIIS